MITLILPGAYISHEDTESESLTIETRSGITVVVDGPQRSDVRMNGAKVTDSGTLRLELFGPVQYAYFDREPRTIDTPGNDPIEGENGHA